MYRITTAAASGRQSIVPMDLDSSSLKMKRSKAKITTNGTYLAIHFLTVLCSIFSKRNCSNSHVRFQSITQIRSFKVHFVVFYIQESHSKIFVVDVVVEVLFQEVTFKNNQFHPSPSDPCGVLSLIQKSNSCVR